MLTDQEIQDLIRSPKEIKEKIPVGGYTVRLKMLLSFSLPMSA